MRCKLWYNKIVVYDVVHRNFINPTAQSYQGLYIVLPVIDYDPSQSKINQENRIKLMLSNARYNWDD